MVHGLRCRDGPGDPRTTHMNTLNISIDSWEDMSLPIEHCAEYDSAAEWCAIRGLKGKVGDPLPANMDPNGALKYINADPESFEKRVRQFAYARAMSNINLRDVFKSMRMAVNAIDDGLPRLAQEILGDALRTYGEEQP